MTPIELMRHTVAIARVGLGKDGHRPFASVIARNGFVICETVSLSAQGNDPTAHAETLAVREACDKLGTRDLSDCDLYTTCEPCPMCASAIWYTRVRKTYYAAKADDVEQFGIHTGALVEQLKLPIAERQHPSEQLMADEASILFSDWNRLQK